MPVGIRTVHPCICSCSIIKSVLRKLQEARVVEIEVYPLTMRLSLFAFAILAGFLGQIVKAQQTTLFPGLAAMKWEEVNERYVGCLA